MGFELTLQVKVVEDDSGDQNQCRTHWQYHLKWMMSEFTTSPKSKDLRLIDCLVDDKHQKLAGGLCRYTVCP